MLSWGVDDTAIRIALATRTKLARITITISPTVRACRMRMAGGGVNVVVDICIFLFLFHISFVEGAENTDKLPQELPIRIPAMKTTTPPTTTCRVAAGKGVSI